jgi:hypothetical protein
MIKMGSFWWPETVEFMTHLGFRMHGVKNSEDFFYVFYVVTLLTSRKLIYH